MAYNISLYVDSRNQCPILEFLDTLNAKETQKCLAYIELLAEFGNRLPANYIKHIENDVWELRPEFGGTEFRFFYFLVLEDTIVILHAVKKKRQRLAQSDIAMALKRAEEVRPHE